MSNKHFRYHKYIIGAIILLAIFGIVVAGRYYYFATKDIVRDIVGMEDRIMELDNRNGTLEYALRKEQEKNAMFESQIGEIAGTVGKLDRLSKTDKELLQKYSKVYFLNENYVPDSLAEIPSEFIYEENKKIQLHSKVLPYLTDLIEAAKSSGIDLKIISGFRSFGDQSALKANYSVVYGSGANRFSADQGYSEHQLGTTLDFTTLKLGAGFTDFKDTDAYKWLLGNAYRYGFVLSYPEKNAYYQFEPWHWRFVGKSLAKRLHEEGQYFYDLDQRTIDSYLINIFD